MSPNDPTAATNSCLPNGREDAGTSKLSVQPYPTTPPISAIARELGPALAIVVPVMVVDVVVVCDRWEKGLLLSSSDKGSPSRPLARRYTGSTPVSPFSVNAWASTREVNKKGVSVRRVRDDGKRGGKERGRQRHKGGKRMCEGMLKYYSYIMR